MAGIIKVDRVQSDSNLAFQVADANVAFMNSTGLQMTGSQLSLGGTTIIPAVGQIAFPASQNASANANTLDDYEEGSWTPIIYGLGSAGTTTYGSNNWGRYQKIGSWVNIQCSIHWTASSGASGFAVIGGLPFTCESFTGAYYTGSIGFFSYGTSTDWTNYWQHILLGGGTTIGYMYYSATNGSAQTNTGILNSSGGYVYVSANYKTAN